VHPQGNEGTIPAKDKGSYPRPMGGPEPNAQGVPADIKSSNVPTTPGYDLTPSLEGSSMSDLQRGYRTGEKLNADSDGMQGA
jgi:hypothetical protein